MCDKKRTNDNDKSLSVEYTCAKNGKSPTVTYQNGGQKTPKKDEELKKSPSLVELESHKSLTDEDDNDQTPPKLPNDIKEKPLRVYNTEENGVKEPEDVFDKMNLEIGLPLSRGTFGVVFRVTKDKTPMVVKMITLRKSDRNKHNRKYRKRITTLEQMKPHSLIVTILDSFIINSTLFVLMEDAGDRNLDTLITEKGLDLATARRYFAQMAIAFRVMHGHLIYHRNMKLFNVFVVPSKKQPGYKDVKVGDFGLTKVPFKIKSNRIELFTVSGSIRYYAPEIIRVELAKVSNIPDNLKFSYFAADIWALGVCLYAMVTNKQYPFETHDFEEMLNHQQNRLFALPKKGGDDGELLDQFLKKMLEPDPKLRLKIDEVVGHRWLSTELTRYYFV